MTKSTNLLASIKKIWSLLNHIQRRKLVILVIFMVLGMFLELLGIGLVIPALGIMTQSDFVTNNGFLAEYFPQLVLLDQQTLVLSGLYLLVVVFFVKFIFLSYLAWKETHFTFEIQEQFSQRLYNIYIYQPYTFHLQRNSSLLIRNTINEVSLFCANAVTPMLVIITELMILGGVATLLVVVEPVGALTVVCILGIAGYLFYYFTHAKIIGWGETRLYNEGLRLQHLQQGLAGIKEVKLFGREIEFLNQYSKHNKESARVAKYHAALGKIPRFWLELLVVVSLTLLVMILLNQGKNMASLVPTLGLFVASAFRLLPSISRVLTAIQSMRYGLPVIEVLHDELSLKYQDNENCTENIFKFSSEIQLANVNYSYPNSSIRSLNEVSVFIEKGESVGFVGSSGAGKSTLVDVILGLLIPDSGHITVDSNNIHDNIRAWQSEIGYVPQTIYLTDDSLVRNIAFGITDKNIDYEAVHHAIKLAQLEDLVSSLDDGLDTFVGERGVRLSGGQRQRIGIARALYHNPSVLVLDEATSSLDNRTENSVMQSVKDLQGLKTIIIIAHRFTTVAHCNRIYRLEHGSIVDEGIPELVLEKDNQIVKSQ